MIMLPPQANGSSLPAAGSSTSERGRPKSFWKACPSKVITPRAKSRFSPRQSTIAPETAATSDGAAESASTSAASHAGRGRVFQAV